jgi:hypothetical protein
MSEHRKNQYFYIYGGIPIEMVCVFKRHDLKTEDIVTVMVVFA